LLKCETADILHPFLCPCREQRIGL